MSPEYKDELYTFLVMLVAALLMAGMLVYGRFFVHI